MDSQDKLQSCVQSYKQLVMDKTSYNIEIFDGSTIVNCPLKFPIDACKHLTGIHKFRLDNIGSTGTDFFKMVLSGNLIFDDICKSDFFIK